MIGPTTFTVWEIDEPEFLDDTETKFKMLLHPVDMAMGTGGKNDGLAKETIDVLADWALRELLRATVKVAFWTALVIAGRLVKKDFCLTEEDRAEP